jgi:hypothetical protein
MAETENTKSKLANPRFSIPLTVADNDDDEGLDLARMNPTNKTKLARMLRRGDTLKELGIEPTAAPAQLGAVADPTSAALDTMLGTKAVELFGLLAVLGAKRAGYADEHAQLMAFRPQQREALAPAVVRILGKYNLLGGKYAEEVAVLALAAGMLADNYMKVKESAEKGQIPLPITPAA